MDFFLRHSPKLVSILLSFWDSANLRDRCYRLQDDWDIMYTALEDVRRINRNSANPSELIERVTTRALNKP